MTFKVRSAMGCAAMMAAILAAGDLRGFECLDDFEDGSVTDGNPCTWTMSYSIGPCNFGPWPYDVKDGKLVLGNNPTDFAGAFIEEILTGDVSVRLQGMSVGGITAVGAIINVDAPICGSSYAGWVNTDGSMGIAQTIPAGATYIASGMLVPPPSLREVLILQFDWTKGELQLRVWRPGEKMPREPLLRAVPPTIVPSGWAAAYCWGSVAYDYIWIWSGPSAAIEVEPESGTAPLDVTVDGSASTTEAGHNLVGYEWDFGDGAVAEGVEASHTYAEAGRYTIWLTVTDDRGLSRSASREIVVSCPPGDTSPWQAADIGEPELAGAFQKDVDCLRVCAGGNGILLASDQLSFASQEFQGDFVLTVEVTELKTQVNGAGVGLMARESLDPKAMMAAICFEKLQNSFVPRFRVRSTAATSGTALGLPVRLRLERSGDEFIGSVSPDGTTWTEVGRRTVDLPEKALVGIAAFGKDSGITPFEALRADACKVSLKAPFRRGDANAEGTTDISDGVAILSYLFLGDKTVPCEQAGDANDDGTLDISDPIYILTYLFRGGKPIEPPVGTCGVDPTGHDLPCAEYPGCQ